MLRLIYLLITASLLLSACGISPTGKTVPTRQFQAAVTEAAATTSPAASPSLPAGSILIHGAGATFPQAVYSAWANAYSYVDPTVKINYQGVGSGAGKKAIIERTVDFAGSDSVLNDAEYAAGQDLQMVPVLAGAIVVIYRFTPVKAYPEGFQVPALVLDRQALVDIYNGSIRTWNDPRITAINPDLADYLPEAVITAVYRSDRSGTTELFTMALNAFSPDWTAGSTSQVEWPVGKTENGVGMEGNQGVAAAVISMENSIGYVELSYAVSNSLTFADMINKAGKKVTANADSLASAVADFDGSAINKNLNITIVDGRGIGSWPISGYTYLILHTRTMPNCLKTQKLIAYIRWTISDVSARDRAERLGFAVLPDAVRAQVLAKLDEVTCQSMPGMK